MNAMPVSMFIFLSVFEGTPFCRFLNKLLDRAFVQLIEGFSLSDGCQVIDTELEAEFFQILRIKIFKR